MINKMPDFAKKYLPIVIGTIVGGAGGFFYWYFIGCSSGRCPITGNPYISSLYGAAIGFLIFSSFKPKKKK